MRSSRAGNQDMPTLLLVNTIMMWNLLSVSHISMDCEFFTSYGKGLDINNVMNLRASFGFDIG